MTPPIEKFREAMTKCRGNVSQVAKAFGVTRGTVHRWINENPEFAEVRDDTRGEFLDEVIATARIVALGIPMKDANGNFAGYQVPPDSGMLRYLLGTLGRNDGFGEKLEVEANVKGAVKTYTPQEARDIIAKIEESC